MFVFKSYFCFLLPVCVVCDFSQSIYLAIHGQVRWSQPQWGCFPHSSGFCAHHVLVNDVTQAYLCLGNSHWLMPDNFCITPFGSNKNVHSSAFSITGSVSWVRSQCNVNWERPFLTFSLIRLLPGVLRQLSVLAVNFLYLRMPYLLIVSLWLFAAFLPPGWCSWVELVHRSERPHVLSFHSKQMLSTYWRL